MPLTRRSVAAGLAALALTSRLPGQTRPRRIVSTAPSITESLFALGLGDAVVGVSQYCKYPAAVTKLPKVGSYLAPDVEAIARLTPDLVIVLHLASELAGRLRALRIAVLEVPEDTLDDIYAALGLIAKAAGEPERGVALSASLRRELAQVQARAKALPSVRVIAIVGRRAGTLGDLIAVGPGNYLQQLLEVAGGTNLLAQAGLPLYPRISLETVLRDDPEVILDMSGHQETEEARRAETAEILGLWKQQPQLSAVRSGRVLVGTSNALVVPGPRAAEAARLLFDDLHGKGTAG